MSLETSLTLSDVLGRLSGVRPSNGQHLACCPAHEDSTPSLTVKSGKEGRILLHCHAGCSIDAITDALGITKSQLFPPSATTNGARGPTSEKHTNTFIYTDENGDALYEVLRYDIMDWEGRVVDKTFKQRRPIGLGEYVWTMSGVRRVLYRLPELIEAVALERPIYVVEGEKCADALWAQGLAAATAAGGASAPWLDAYSETLSGASVVVLPDNDEPGRKHAAKVVNRLTGIAGSVRVVALPGLPDKGDVVDYLNAGHTAADLLGEIERGGDGDAAPTRPFLTAREIEQLPPPRYLVEDIIPEHGLAEIHGPPGSGKSFFALALACDVSIGFPFLGHPVRRGPVVYVAAEGTAGLGARFRAWKAERGLSEDRDVEVYFKRGSVQLLDSSDLARFIADVQSLAPTPVLIVFDTFARCFVGGEENSAKDVGQAMEAAASIQRATGAAVFLLHHTRKDGEAARGSTAFAGAMDTMIALKNEGGWLRVSCEKQKDAAEFAALDVVLKPVAESCVIAPKTAWESSSRTLGKFHQKLVVALSHFQRDGGASASAWEKAAEVSSSTFHRTRNELLDWGYATLDKKGRGGRYSLTPAGELLITPNSQVTPKPLRGSNASSLPPNPPPLGVGSEKRGSDNSGRTAA